MKHFRLKPVSGQISMADLTKIEYNAFSLNAKQSSDQLEIIQVDFYTVSIAHEKLFSELLIWLSTHILDC